MNFNEYQELARKTAKYPPDLWSYPFMGLCGESGEAIEKVKKIYRDANGERTPENEEAIAKELGDVLWYLASCAYEIGYDLSEIAAMNLAKLSDRRDRNVISGSGDER